MIAGICSSPEVLSVVEIILTVIKIIKIAVPILLLLACTISFVRVVKNDEEFEKVKKGIVNKVIAAILIFFIPTIVNIIGLTSGFEDYKECINLATGDYISESIREKVERLIKKFEESEEFNDYLNAKNYIYTVRDDKLREEALARLQELYDEIFVAEGTCSGEYENEVGYATLSVDVTKGKGVSYKFINGGMVVQEGSETTYKSKNIYEILVNPVVEITSKSGKVKTAECIISHRKFPKYYKNGYYFHKSSAKDKNEVIDNPYPQNGLSYWFYVPKDLEPNDKVPLILALHGGFGWGVPCNGSTTSEANQTYHFLKSAIYKEKFKINGQYNYDVRALIIAPSNMTCNWEPSAPKALDIMYTFIKLFNIDIDSVVVTGGSQGGYGTLYSGFLDEHILYKATDNDTTLESVAKMYGTTAEDVKSYNKKVEQTISYSDTKQTKLKKGSVTLIRPKSDLNMRSTFSFLMPMSPAKNATRCIFTPSTKYDDDSLCKTTPPYTIKRPIWVESSNDEYAKIQYFAKELTAYYEKNGDIRYTVLTGLHDPHYTEIPFYERTNLIDFMASQKYDEVKIRNNPEIDAIEAKLGENFVKDWHP